MSVCGNMNKAHVTFKRLTVGTVSRSVPAMHAVMKAVMLPLMSARGTREVMVPFLMVLMASMAPRSTPMDPRLPNPQHAYVAITADRS
jgi:hypothetical protein